MYLINSLEYKKKNKEWLHTSTRVIHTCTDINDVKRKMDSLKELHTKVYRQEYRFQKLGGI